MYEELRMRLETELATYEKLTAEFNEELKTLPYGHLSYKQIRGRHYLFHQYTPAARTNNTELSSHPSVKGAANKLQSIHYSVQPTEMRIQKILSSKSPDAQVIAQGLKRRRFIEKSLTVFQVNIHAIHTFLHKYISYDPSAIADNLSAPYKNIPMPIPVGFLPAVAEEWLQQECKSNPYWTENLIHTTIHGKRVRSKSEALIADMLELYQIPFRYEAEFPIEGSHPYSIYPDFTTLRTSDNKVIYWEHFGMVSDEDYLNSMEHKLSLYRKNGVSPWNNLIITFDDRNGSIDSSHIHRILQVFY